MKMTKLDNTNLVEEVIMPAPRDALKGSPSEELLVFDVVLNLFQALNQAGVSYCHWKSNIRLEEALQSKTDLDLLVADQHVGVFRKILEEFNIKPLNASPGKDYPNIENYLGFDPSSGNLFHLHVHYQLILGEQFVKNYRLPIETHFLKDVIQLHGVKTPTPELEIIVFCLRALLKYRDRDGIKDMLSIRSPGLPSHVLREAEWLLVQTTTESVSQTLQELDDWIPTEIVLDFLQLVTNSPRNGCQLVRLRNRLRRALRPFQRYSRFRASLMYFREFYRRRVSLLKFNTIRKMALTTGGRTLALIGADGAGKSTMGRMLHKWLSWKLDVQFYYLGSKQPSLTSKMLYTLFRMSRRTHRDCARRLGEKNLLSRKFADLGQVFLYSHHISISYDRLRRLRSSQGRAAGGAIVIYDRFPLAASLDGPKISVLANGKLPVLTQVFSRWENQIYRKFNSPDYYFLLNVDPDVALQRKPDHVRSAIEIKYKVLQELLPNKSDDLEIVYLDAEEPFDDVVAKLKEALWQVL
jgi:thymidylate kinase